MERKCKKVVERKFRINVDKSFQKGITSASLCIRRENSQVWGGPKIFIPLYGYANLSLHIAKAYSHICWHIITVLLLCSCFIIWKSFILLFPDVNFICFFKVITFVLKDLNVVKTQSAKTGIPKLLVSARMVTFLSRETLPTVKVSELFNIISL